MVLEVVSSAYGDSYTTGDIIGFALDLDNAKLYFGKTELGKIQVILKLQVQQEQEQYQLTLLQIMDGMTIIFGAGNMVMVQLLESINFGNGYFGTTLVTAGVADAGGEGHI